MRILVVSQFYYPEPFQKLKDLCEGFVAAGHNVTVLTGLPNYPTGIIEKEYRNRRNRRQEINGVRIVRIPLIPRRNTKVGLALNYLSWSAIATLKVLFWHDKFDVVFCYQTSPVLVLFPAWLAKLKNHCLLVGYCLDLWPVSMLTLLKSEKNPVFKTMSLVSRNLYRNCDVIAITSKPFKHYFEKEHAIEEEKLIYIPQHGNDDYLNKVFSAESDGKVHFLFTGNMGTAQDLGTILKAVELVKNKQPFVVDFVGTGSTFESCRDFVREHHLESKVCFHGRKPYTELPAWYAKADACLVTLKHENAIGLTLPGKMQDYLAVGKPIIGAIDGAAKEVIQEAQCGLCVPSGDYKALAKSFDLFLEDPEKFRSCGERAREYYREHFTKERVLQQFLGLLTRH